ncbi:DEAD/DEAH box helicase [Breoghania sp.]|uniref:DEAD/DEAH box helicase n=1 Tax=Breoghania sp. TaxID=2065378 RepID=UPI002AA78CD0|nr:DEAD/DEAH box helicase [Breoghania sp.]
MAFVLRDYQAEIIRGARSAMAGGAQSVLCEAPTGAGKTALSAFMAASTSRRGKRVVFGVHRRELITQTAKTFEKVGIPFGIIASGFTGDRRQLVQIASIPTLSKRLDWYGTPDLYVIDECHHAGAKTWADIIERYRTEGARNVGLSATPERLDGTGLGRWFETMVRGPSTAWLIEQGYLSPYEMYAPAAPDLAGVRRTGGDFNRGQLEKKMNGVSVIGNAVEHYRRIADGRRAILFCVSIKHSLAVVDQFRAAGIRAAHIDGLSDDRDALIRAFTRGEIQVLSSVDLVSEGFDLPAIEVAMMLRPTHSVGLYIQQVGRVLRPVYADGFDLTTQAGRLDAIAAGPKPIATILDHAGNSRPKSAGGRGHGLPDDVREWSLAGRERKQCVGDDGDEPAVNVRQCPTCFRVHAPAPVCPKCGHVYPVLGRTVNELEGMLEKIEKETMQRERRVEQGKAHTREDLVALGRARNMRYPELWAEKVIAARSKKKTMYRG